MFALLVLRSLTSRGNGLGIAWAAVMVGAAVISALALLHFDVSIKMSEELRSFGANMVIAARPDGAGPVEAEASALRAAIAALPREKLVGATPFLYGVVRLDAGDAVVAGVDFTGLQAISPFWQVDGGWVAVDFDERNVMVGRRLAGAMQIKPGAALTIANRERTRQVQVRVKGVVDTGGAEDDQLFAAIALVQRLLDRPGRADLAMASVVARGHEADGLAAALGERFPGLSASPIRKLSQADGAILEKIEGLMALVAAIILVITMFCVNATLTAMVAARTPQIGLQKAIGAGNRSIVLQFMAETAVIALAGAAAGLLVGFGLAQLLGQAVFGAWIGFRPIVLPLTAGACLTAALAAAALPVRAAVRILPARVLKGE